MRNALKYQEELLKKFEPFAEKFEHYLATGRAPSTALEVAFQLFRINVGAFAEKSGAAITPLSRIANPDGITEAERAVFDQIYATDRELAHQRAFAEATQFIRTPSDLGMSVTEWLAHGEKREAQLSKVAQKAEGRIITALQNSIISEQRRYIKWRTADLKKGTWFAGSTINEVISVWFANKRPPTGARVALADVRAHRGAQGPSRRAGWRWGRGCQR
jgi:hypothetical protein